MNLRNKNVGELIDTVIEVLSAENEAPSLPEHEPALVAAMETFMAIAGIPIGSYVIVRCRDAGVHCGFLKSHFGRSCTLSEDRRLWRWYPKEGHKWLSALAVYGIDEKSKVSVPVPLIHLTENCEIIPCSEKAKQSLRNIKADQN